MLTEIYYLLKPILPWRLRVALRQVRAQRRRKAFADVWPIDPSAAAVPNGWPGWPEGKQFAFVLSHDVEGQKGFDRIPKVVELTRKYGFRASFNLIPKGEYPVDRQILDFLDRSGFEAGVHGLEHDGKLYKSKQKFVEKALQIRRVLQNWNACGFRSPLMQHRLGWIHEFGCDYDASTFDVDPFEPQPDGMSTIFPFWVKGEGNTGYVELPYSIVQDFSLYIVLGEKNNDIWKKKLDWVAGHGGMALINTHPDYMCFNGKSNRDEFPVALYEDFLRYAREKYGDVMWHALPREVAGYYRAKLPACKRNTRRKICMVAYSEYESGSRIRRYAETLAWRGDMVDVITRSSSPGAESRFHLNGVTIHRVPGRDSGQSGPIASALRQLGFIVRASAAVSRLQALKRYDVVHVFNNPDLLVFSAWSSKLDGARVVLDIHEVVPESFAAGSNSPLRALYSAMLRLVEKWSVKFVDRVIVSSPFWREQLVARSVDAGRCSVMVDHVDKEYTELIDALSTEHFHVHQLKPDLTPAVGR